MYSRKNKIAKSIPVLIACLAMLLPALSVGANSNQPQINPGDFSANVKKITARAGQITKLQVESPNASSAVEVTNRSASTADIDVMAYDKEGNEVARQTEEVAPNLKITINLQNLFPELSFTDLGSIQVQSSVRPAGNDGVKAQYQLPVAFFSQRDPSWSGNQLGTCATNIYNQGCYISCIAMAGAHVVNNCNPGTMNAYLSTKNASGNPIGYQQGCSVIYSVAANIDGAGGLLYLGSDYIGSAASLKLQIDSGKFLMVKSTRFYPSNHVGLIIGYDGAGTSLTNFYYLDPWDTSVPSPFRHVGDGFVSAGAVTQIFQ